MKHKDMKAILLATRNSLSRIWALLRNEIESLLKDKQSLLIIFLLPLAVMLPFKFTNIGEAQREESEKVKKVPKKKMEGTAP
ncbi:MAG: hypothetical protein GYA24_24540 [Candidatus Lokiarchaeota archaeon]|nr:hypothetical protein [Candidatus Lokiarchaeota archaeon]